MHAFAEHLALSKNSSHIGVENVIPAVICSHLSHPSVCQAVISFKWATWARR
jgi:hypothetical protein